MKLTNVSSILLTFGFRWLLHVFGAACSSLWCLLMIHGSHTCNKCEIDKCMVGFAYFSFSCLLMLHGSHTCNMREINECMVRFAYFSFCCLLMLHIIDLGYFWLSVARCGSLGCPWLFVAVSGCQWLSVAVCVAVCGYLWLSVAVCASQRFLKSDTRRHSCKLIQSKLFIRGVKTFAAQQSF